MFAINISTSEFKTVIKVELAASLVDKAKDSSQQNNLWLKTWKLFTLSTLNKNVQINVSVI